ncbi:hypothetical protein MSEO_40750 [Mycobacterium seoulense]|uniref:Uncharacterized protein n=1 Tax=Mycobacterium seoulense TaxID=386911 RepID=A0A7I7P3Y0_9MYCO|nr:hypothetical protein MSEO_40750 [Mycobacterium seoulense]
MAAAAQAPTEHGGQGGDEAEADGPRASGSHDAIVAPGGAIDKLLVNFVAGGTLSPCDAPCLPTGNPPCLRW